MQAKGVLGSGVGSSNRLPTPSGTPFRPPVSFEMWLYRVQARRTLTRHEAHICTCRIGLGSAGRLHRYQPLPRKLTDDK